MRLIFSVTIKKELFLVEEKLLVGDLCFETFSEKANYFFGFL